MYHLYATWAELEGPNWVLSVRWQQGFKQEASDKTPGTEHGEGISGYLCNLCNWERCEYRDLISHEKYPCATDCKCTTSISIGLTKDKLGTETRLGNIRQWFEFWQRKSHAVLARPTRRNLASKGDQSEPARHNPLIDLPFRFRAIEN